MLVLRGITTRLHPTVESLSVGIEKLFAAGEAERYTAPSIGKEVAQSYLFRVRLL